jgi:hypothetical protein
MVTLDLDCFNDWFDLSAIAFRFIVNHGSMGGRFGYRTWLAALGTDREGRVWYFEPIGDEPHVLTCVRCDLAPPDFVPIANPAIFVRDYTAFRHEPSSA